MTAGGSDGFVFACVLDGAGGGRFGDRAMVRDWKPEDGILWVHLDLGAESARTWLHDESGLDEITEAALAAGRSRPRAVARGDTLLVNLRGVNLNPGATPDDMVSVRVAMDGTRIITTRRRRLKALRDIRRALEQDRGPRGCGEFLVAMIDNLLRRMGASLDALDARIDDLQVRIADQPGGALRTEIAEIRNQVIALRRYLAPQRDAVLRLQTEQVPWLDALHREHLRELADRTVRRVEDLDAARDRATVAHEELTSRMAEQMNRTMYVLAIVTTVFLPLGLLTGLLGINVGGMPGAENELAFWIVCGLLVVLAIGQWFWLRKRRLL